MASQRHFREGGNPGKIIVHGETVSGNGKEPGRQNGQSKAIPNGEPDAGDPPVRSQVGGASRCAVPAFIVVEKMTL